MCRRFGLGLVIGLIVSLAGLPQVNAAAPAWQDDVLEVIEGYLVDKKMPGLSVAVVENGKLVHVSAHGQSNVEMNLPATTGTVYPISSVSKIFAGPVALSLVREGKLDLDTSILEYLPQLPEEYAPITMRHLLSHTHGLKDHYQSEEWDAMPDQAKEAMTADEVMLWNAPRPFQFETGKGWSYSLLGFTIAQRAMETVAGKAYEDLVQERILTPLEMDSAIFGGTETIVPNRHPVLYERDQDGQLFNHEIHFSRITYAAGGLNASVLDMAKYLIAIEKEQLLDAKAWQEIWTAYPHIEADQISDDNFPFYGLGWSSYRRPSTGRYIVGHEGGGNAWLYYWPEEKLGIVALSNLSGARADLIAHDIAAAIFAAK